MKTRKKQNRVTAAERRAFYAELFAAADAQKRQYEATRRRRLREFGRLYVPLQVDDASVCYYCRTNAARTQDHCPSLLAVDSFGPDYFRQQKVALLLVPSCMDCNNAHSGAIVFRNGRRRPFSWRAAREWMKKTSGTPSGVANGGAKRARRAKPEQA